MKFTLIFIFALLSLGLCAQIRDYTGSISKGVVLHMSVAIFFSEQHKMDTCVDEFNNKFICRIDNKQWYGMDRGLELPTSQLISLKISINGKEIPLNVSGMFNPGSLDTNKFEFKKVDTNFFLSSFFSDGAGTYIAKWIISKGKSKRILISTDEKDFGN